MTEAQERAKNWLLAGKVRPTRQRLVLAQLLVGDGKNRHVCAESLHAAAASGPETVSLATVYNTLRTFCDAGLLSEITIEGNKSYFDTRTDDHSHYYWEDESKVTDAPKSAVKFAKVAAAPEGMEISRVDVVIRLRSKR